jgi:N-acetylneuraminate synthase/N,N'-diacetyllegionaminate synthase
MAARNGLQAVKFQKRDINQLAISEVLEAKDLRFPEFGSTYGDIRRYLEFNENDFFELKEFSEQFDLDFFITPFDSVSLNLIDKLNLEIIKIASHSVTNTELLSNIALLNKDMILSTGMCNLSELDEAVAILSKSKGKLIILHCVSSYPLAHENANLNVIDLLRSRYGLPVGYSGHEIDYRPTVYAFIKGARIIERHITLDKKSIGFDHKLSLDEFELRNLMADLDSATKILGSGEKKLNSFEEITRNKYRVSMVSARKLGKGTILSKKDITWKNPGIGIPPGKFHDFLGKTLNKDIAKDNLILEEDFYNE